MDKHTIIGLIRTVKYIDETFDDYTTEYDYWMSDGFELVDYILDLIGFPKDNTIKYADLMKSVNEGEEVDLPDDYFCRDYLWHMFDGHKPVNIYYSLMTEIDRLHQDNRARP